MKTEALKELSKVEADAEGNIIINAGLRKKLAEEYGQKHEGPGFKIYQETLAQIIAALCGFDNWVARKRAKT